MSLFDESGSGENNGMLPSFCFNEEILVSSGSHIEGSEIESRIN